MRQRPYGESDLTIETTLTWGPGFQRFTYMYESDTHDIDYNFFTAMSHSVAFFDRYVKEDG